MRKSTPEPISDVLKNVVERLSRTKERGISKIVSVWGACAGRRLCRHTRPANLKRGTLLVYVDESAWLYQANLQKEQLLEALQKRAGAKVQNIQFRIGKV